MFWKFIYIIGVLSQFTFGLETKDELEVPYEDIPSFEDDESDMTAIFEAPENDNLTSSENIIAVDEDYETECPPEGATNFAGPVKAKGTVSVAATFGYDGSARNPSLTNNGQFWSIPGFLTQYYLPSPPLMVSPIPIAFSPMPLQSMTFPGIGNPLLLEIAKKSLYEDTVEKPVRKDVFLEITPLKGVDEMVPVKSKSNDPAVEDLHLDEIVENPVVFNDEDFTDYDDEKIEDNMIEADEIHSGTVFGGFVPASGTVKIAARF